MRDDASQRQSPFRYGIISEHMSTSTAEQDQSRPVCGWCRHYLRHRSADGFCSDACRALFARYGMNRLELQLRHTVFNVRGASFRKSCRWCYGFFWTGDPAAPCCSPEHETAWRAHGRRSASQVALDAYEPEKAERRRTRGFVRLVCAWCGTRFEGRPGSRFCCEAHQRLARRHGGTQAEFYEKFAILGEEGGKYRKRCQCCGREFLTANVTQSNCSATCNKRFAKHGRLSDALVGTRREALRSTKAAGVAVPSVADWRAGVEWVMSLPADQRFAFTRDWTDRERDYAQRLLHAAPDAGRALDEGGLRALAAGVEDLDGVA